LEEGSVSTVTSAGALSGANGVAVLGGFAFVADGARIIRVDPGSGAISVLAGSANSSGCADTPVGAAAQFWPDGDVKVVGSDGRYVFVTDSCGLRRVDPVTGGTVTLTTAQYTSVTIAGHSLYAVDGSSLYRYDLDTGILSRLGWAPGGVIAADANQLWAVDGSVLSRVDPTNGRTTTDTTNLPTYAGTPPSALLSAGDYLYAAPRGHAPGYGSTLIRIDKATGVWKPVAGVDAAGHVDGVELDAWFGGIRGIASDGTRLYVADSGAGYGSWLRAVQG
jgi:hypothetical protein